MAITFVGSSEAAATNGGNVTLTYPTDLAVNDCAILAVTLGTTRTIGMAVTSSSGAAIYTTIVSSITTGNERFAVFRRVIGSTGETQVSVSGTAGTSDCTTAVVMVFRGVDPTTPEDATATSTTGTGTTPNSPSITVVSCGCAIISAFGSNVSDTTVTAPSSFLNQTDINGNDTIDATTGQAWLTYSSTAAFDPASWTNVTSAVWAAATIALRPYAPQHTYQNYFSPFPDFYRTQEIVGY